MFGKYFIGYKDVCLFEIGFYAKYNIKPIIGFYKYVKYFLDQTHDGRRVGLPTYIGYINS